MAVVIREARESDTRELGRICFEAFRMIASAHNFPPDLPSADVAAGVIGALIPHPGCYGVVAEADGRILGSNFLDERNPISGVGPITVDPLAQNKGVGAALMHAVMARSAAKGFAGTRLVQAGYHCRSLTLYLKLGFEVREHLSCLQGPAMGDSVPGVRVANAGDLAACNALCARIHGADRGGELKDAIDRGGARVVERDGRIAGYTTQIAFFGHAVGETNDDLKALIGTAEQFGGPGFLVPSRNGELMRWCLARGLKMTQPMTLMSMGLYNEPAGVWLPSVTY